MPVITSNHHHNSKEGVLMIINTNMGSSTAARILANNTSALQKSLKRLSTGSKIASISDDAAGVAVATKFSAQVSRLSASKDNLSNMVSYAQTQESYLDQVSKALDRMSELAMLATDETKSTSDTALYDKEFQELDEFINAIGSKQFNGITLFNGAGLTVTTGLNEQVSLTGATLYAGASFVALSSATIGSPDAAYATLTTVQNAISALASTQSDVGSNLSRLEREISSISVLKDNISAARSRIMDVDVAEESANFAKQQILVQSGTAMLAQANILPQSALRLIN
jgi:flagellin